MLTSVFVCAGVYDVYPSIFHDVCSTAVHSLTSVYVFTAMCVYVFTVVCVMGTGWERTLDPLHSLNYKHLKKSTQIASKYHQYRTPDYEKNANFSKQKGENINLLNENS